MAIREIRAKGFGALPISSALMQRARKAHATWTVWDAADIQWSWARPRESDAADRLFWFDEHGPVAGIIPSSWAHGTWQCDPVIVPGCASPTPEEVWHKSITHMQDLTPSPFDIPLRDDDVVFIELATQAGFMAGEGDTTNWMDTINRTEVLTIPSGYRLVDRTQRLDVAHPLEQRNGRTIVDRLRQCSIYSPSLDLAIEADRGEVAAYALFWFDPETRTGMVEPVRVEDAHQRRGLARAILSKGLDLLANRGAERIKVVHETDAAGSLYAGVGFRPESTTTWYRSPGHE